MRTISSSLEMSGDNQDQETDHSRTSDWDFNRAVRNALNDGWQVVPGTYATGLKPYYEYRDAKEHKFVGTFFVELKKDTIVTDEEES